jgi:hypothetical protein
LDACFIGAFSFTVLAQGSRSPSQFWLQETGCDAKTETLVGKEGGGLPRVLLLGDSISLGYGQAVHELLGGRATVFHPRESSQSTVLGLLKLEKWLGDKNWDVIHFNWGIWDAHH